MRQMMIVVATLAALFAAADAARATTPPLQEDAPAAAAPQTESIESLKRDIALRIREFRDTSEGQRRLNSGMSIALSLTAILASFGATIFGVRRNVTVATGLSGLFTAVLLIHTVFPLAERVSYYRLLTVKSDVLIDQITFAAQTRDQALAVLTEFNALREQPEFPTDNLQALKAIVAPQQSPSPASK